MNLPLKGMRIGLLTPWASRAGGGVFEAVVRQADMIQGLGGEARVFALDDRHVTEDSSRFSPGRLSLSPTVGPGVVGFAPDLAQSMIDANLDLLHLHGIWMYPSSAGARWAKTTGKPYLISPHGMLDPWITGRGRWKKALARLGYERRSWRAATAFHALTAREASDIERETASRRSLVIPNAGPVPTALSQGYSAPQVTYIGRIHSKKNLLPLVEAWRNLPKQVDARLTLAGWGDAADVAALKAAIAPDPTISFIGSIFGAEKDALVARSRFVVLPSLSEGLPMAILEAWAAGVPTVMTDECNLPEGFAAGAALPCGYDAAGIASTLSHALSLDEGAWHAMSEAASGLARSHFSAETVAQRWADAYRSLSGIA
ncbi:glycosyltransferase [Novosphingobium olei]|uniref:Glycosyltransferase n=1 Tax=Novosphingobium olei TaxID=2728851 RepID=A0A7Y0BRR9_9SPHN|nr:glycosyltransferase [Novosphingobium olei]NML95372.1 glycosyltransferase [Novosphingobium olei]